RRAGRGAGSHRAVRTRPGVPQPEVVEDGADDDRDDGDPSPEARALAFEMGHHAEAGLEAEGAPPGEDDGVDVLGEMGGIEDVLAENARGATRDGDPRDGAGGAEDRRHARQADGIGGVADEKPGDVGEAAHPDQEARGARRTDSAGTRPRATSPATSRLRSTSARTKGRWRGSRVGSAKARATAAAIRASAGRPVSSRTKACSSRRPAQSRRAPPPSWASTTRSTRAASRSALTR